MKDKIENILLGLLWLLVATLGTTFWFNTKFGFDIFSGTHWKYLATHQATHQNINAAFYPSMVLSVFITLFVLYLLVRPRFRKIKLPVVHKSENSESTKPVYTPESVALPEPKSALDIVSAPQSDTTPAPQPVPFNMTRPPRLAINPMASYGPAPQTPTSQPTPTVAQPVQQPSPAPVAQPAQTNLPAENPDLIKIFTDMGYEIKKSPRIGGTQFQLLAIGQNEVLWLGGVGISTMEMNRAAEQMANLFLDTLDGIEIDIRTFTVYAPDTGAPTNPNVLTFDSFSALREYVSEHPNPPLADTDAENFAAYSEYISTVIEYLGKM